MRNCIHIEVTCINPYELIRKYRCDSCGEVMMCYCEREFARRFLPHQLNEGTELDTQLVVPVTAGFQENTCNTCRGLPEESFPKAETYGKSSKVLRYYWREIFFETMQRFGDWADSKEYRDYAVAQHENPDTYARINKEVIEEIKALHERSPKYHYREKSQRDVLVENDVEVVQLKGTYVRQSKHGVGILDKDEVYSAEEYAALHYKRMGYEVLFAESVPFHVIFGIYMWPLVQDPKDPRVRTVGFGDRFVFEEGRQGETIWTHLPEDFGTSGYALRRAGDIEDHFKSVFANERNGLYFLFDYWLEPSMLLRQYLWAHRVDDVNKARTIMSVLSVNDIHRILRYLVGDYWRRYVGWPDLVVYNHNEFFFAEVKSSKDKIRESQKSWIIGNHNELHFPFKLVKIHKMVN